MKALNQEVKVLMQCNFDELINLVLFKCPWLNPSTSHYKSFKLFMNFCMRFLGLRSSLIPSLVSSLLSQSLPSACQSSASAALLFGPKKFASLKELKAYLEAQLVANEAKVERNNETIGSSIEEDLTPFNNPECSQILLTLWKKYGEDFVEGNWHIFTNDAKEYVASNGKTSRVLQYRDHLLALQQKVSLQFKEAMEHHFAKVGTKVVDFICALFKEFPLSSSTVLGKLFEKFPYKKLPLEQQYYYFKLMLTIAGRCTSMEEGIVSFCVGKLLLIDADAKTYWRSKVVFDAEAVGERLEKAVRKVYDETENKVSAVLGLLFEYFDKRLEASMNCESELEEFADMVLKIFEEEILPSHKTNYIQYMLLYLLAAPVFNIFREKFISLLLIQSADQRVFHEKRVVLLSYFASTIGLSTFLTPQFIAEALRIYIADHANDSKTLYPHFVQSLAYVLCYKVDLLRECAEVYELMTSLLLDGEVLRVVEPNLRECLLNTVGSEGACEEEGKKKETTAAMYWFFGGVNYLPIIHQKLKDKLLHLPIVQKRKVEPKTSVKAGLKKKGKVQSLQGEAHNRQKLNRSLLFSH